MTMLVVKALGYYLAASSSDVSRDVGGSPKVITRIVMLSDASGNFQIICTATTPMASREFTRVYSEPNVLRKFRGLGQGTPRRFNNGLLRASVYSFTLCTCQFPVSGSMQVRGVFITNGRGVSFCIQGGPSLPKYTA